MGIAGVSIWPLYYWGAISGYNGRSHAFVQTDCFLYAFIVGFLWTALPKFTGTSTPSHTTQYFVACLLVAAVVAFEFQYFRAGHVIFVAVHATVIAVAATRFIRRQHPPPEIFVLVGFGLLSGMMGAILTAGIAWNWIPLELDILGRRLLTEGMVLLLVLGIGGFLGPRLLGFAQLPNFQNLERLPEKREPAFVMIHRQTLYALAGLLILLSVVVEYGWSLPALAWLRAGIGTALVLVNIAPWKKPVTRTTLSWCVWIAHWFLIAALWTVVIAPKYRIDFLHIMFMGAFTLLILSVGTRVVLSHGGYGSREESRSWPLRIGITTVIIAMFARIGAPFAPFTYFAHLAWAGVLWITGIGIWGIYLLRRIRLNTK
jgi:uncharacterized protein involved in response to NO